MTRIPLGAVLLEMVALSFGANPVQEKAEPGIFVDEGKRAVTQINGGEFKDLLIRYPIADAARTADYTVIRFSLRTANWVAYKEFTRAAFQNQLKDQKLVSYWAVRSDGKEPDVVTHNYYGEPAGGISLADLCETPRSTEKDVVHEVTASVKLHVKTGEKEEYRQAQKTWVKLPIYDEGQELWKATLAIQLKKLTGVRDPGGVIEVGIVDPKTKTYETNERFDGLQVKGVRFALDTGKNQYDHEASWTGMRVLYVTDEDVQVLTEGATSAVEFVKKDMVRWLNHEHDQRKVSWGSLFELSETPDPKFIDKLEWTKETVGAYSWEVLRFEVPYGKVGKKKDEDDPEEKYESNSISVLVAVTYAKPYTNLFAAPIVIDAYFGVPMEKTYRKIEEVRKSTWGSVRILKK